MVLVLKHERVCTCDHPHWGAAQPSLDHWRAFLKGLAVRGSSAGVGFAGCMERMCYPDKHPYSNLPARLAAGKSFFRRPENQPGSADAPHLLMLMQRAGSSLEIAWHVML